MSEWTEPKNEHVLYLYQSPKISPGTALYTQTDFLNNLIYIIIKYRTPILGRKNQMVYQYSCVVALMYILTHIAILRRKRRGIFKGIVYTPKGRRIQPYGVKKR